MLEDPTSRESSVETITSFHTEDSCSTVSARSSENVPELPEPAALRRFPVVSAHAHALRTYNVKAADSSEVAPNPASAITLTLRWGFSAMRAPIPATADGSLDPSSGSSPLAFREGVAKVVFPLPEDAERQRDRRLALVLAVNRDLISKCASILHPQSKSGDQNNNNSNAADTETPHGLRPAHLASLPREGMQLTLYFTHREVLNPHNTNASANPAAQPYLCRSFDLVSFMAEGSKALSGVPLKPYHRYHLKYHAGRGIELNLNKHFVLHLYADSDPDLGEKERAPALAHPEVASEAGKRGGKRPRQRRVSAGAARHPPHGAAALVKSEGTRPPRKRAAPPRTSPPPLTEHSSIDSFPPFSSDSGGSDEAAAAPLLRRRRVLFTTGLRLSSAQERACAGLGFLVNPSLSKAREASILVVKAPLIRSVKLLTVLPYLKALVDRRWLDDMLAQGNPQLPFEGYAYVENKRAGGIEHTNRFSLESTLRIPVEQRQCLFAGHVFWVHPSAAPQEPPMNDLHTVLTASGGKISKSITDANIWVLPSRTPSAGSMKLISTALKSKEVSSRRRQGSSSAGCNNDLPLSCLLSPSVGIVAPDDIFRSVLQQQDLGTFTLQKYRLDETAQYLWARYISMRAINGQGLRSHIAAIQTNRYLTWCHFRAVTTPGSRVRVNFILDSLAPVLRDEFDAKANEETLRHLIQRSPQVPLSGSVPISKKEGKGEMEGEEEGPSTSVVEIRVLGGWVHPVSWKCTRCGAGWVARPADRVNPQTRESTSCPGCQAMQNAPSPSRLTVGGADPSATVLSQEDGGSTLASPSSPASLLVEQYPMIASQWDEERNSLWQNGVVQSLHQVRTSSSMVVWFRCTLCARAWRESICSRVARYEDLLEKTPRVRRGEVVPLCPFCEERGAGQRFQSTSSSSTSATNSAPDRWEANASPVRFLSQDLLLMEEVCLRSDQDPSTIPLRSEQVLSWRCRYCGYRYQSSLRKRVMCYEGCPQCRGKVCTPMNSLTIQRPDVVREIAKTISRTRLTKLTIFSEQEIPFVCRTCFSPYRMTAKARCMIPKGGIACQKCFLNFSQTVSSEMGGSMSYPKRLTAKKRRQLRDKAHRLCLSNRSKEKLEAARNEIERRDRILIN